MVPYIGTLSKHEMIQMENSFIWCYEFGSCQKVWKLISEIYLFHWNLVCNVIEFINDSCRLLHLICVDTFDQLDKVELFFNNRISLIWTNVYVFYVVYKL